MRAGGVHGRGVGLVRAVDGEQGQGADDLGGFQQPAQFVQGEGGLAEGEGVAADEGEGVVVVERLGFGGARSPPGVFAGQRQAGLGEGGDVTGTDGPELVHDRMGAALQRLAQGGDDAGPEARPAGQQLVGAHGEHRAHLSGGQFLADGTGVAAQQPEAVFGGRLGGHVLVPVGSDAGGAAVDAAGGGDLPGGVPGPLDTPCRLAPGNRSRRAVGEPDDVQDAEADPVEDDESGARGPRRVHDLRRH